jgi:uncharacterized protein YecE (DUF72 family)
MDFGALPPHRSFDAQLAPLWPPGVHRLPGTPVADAEIRVGAVQWNVPAWVGETYPKGTKAGDYLAAYGKQWNAIELNTSFYRNAAPEQVRAWADKTPEAFRFSVKIHQELSHDPAAFSDRPLRLARMKAFAESWRVLGEKWKESFLQLPPGFTFAEFPKLRTWLEDWPADIPPVHIEFRHASWFSERQLRPEVRDEFVRRGIGGVITDTPGRRDASHGTLTSDHLIVRFLAQTTPEYPEVLGIDEERLSFWAKRIAGLLSRGLRSCSFFVHTPDHVWVPALCRKFAEDLVREAGEAKNPLFIQAPRRLEETQISLFN